MRVVGKLRGRHSGKQNENSEPHFFFLFSDLPPLGGFRARGPIHAQTFCTSSNRFLAAASDLKMTICRTLGSNASQYESDTTSTNGRFSTIPTHPSMCEARLPAIGFSLRVPGHIQRVIILPFEDAAGRTVEEFL
jgi:hypothetical protein